ncbi:ESX secretion-associated protein EspG [Nocardia rosealba]|uniref:ESX secretion-associated protein EspG n=1 Tax=Nocardia rosealba TaxID=2878563 RepID=UPI001CD9CEF3|nr:ESX secretion-associated protein EspG [Nocardia rosealba]MCA2210185.1 ESX secretion-associated protein EspG [Nocardia rosealba]
MNRTWNLTELEMFTLWEWATSDFVPWPFFCRTRTLDADELDRQKADALAGLQRNEPEFVGFVLEALLDPDIKVIVHGHDGVDDMKVDALVRVMGCRRGDRGYVIRQKPGDTYWDSGGYVVTECDAVGLADYVVRELPENAPGREADLVLETGDRAAQLDYSYAISSVHDSFDDPAPVRAKQFESAPLVRAGEVEVIQGRSRFGPRGVTRHKLSWRDVVDDGRYVIAEEVPRVAVAADAKRFTELINQRIAEVVRAIKDERV